MIEINNLTNFAVDKKFLTGVAKKVLKGENKETHALSLAFITKPEMQELNKKHRGKNEPTDVLSFEGINEIVICPEMVKEKGEDIMKVFTHGILHLLGYDHERSEKNAEEMEEKENFYLNKT